MIFDGCWSDPKHPDGYRVIKISDNVEKQTGAKLGTVSGSDTGMVQDYSLPVRAFATSSWILINIDFPVIDQHLSGYGNMEPNTINWIIEGDDSYKWVKVDESKCPSTVKPAAFLQ